MSTMTHEETRLEQVREFILAACADGWSLEPTYPGCESVDRACTLKREGYVIQALARSPQQANICIWGPDKLALAPPTTYAWEAIQAGLRTCMECGATDVETFRVGFAGRVCMSCAPVVRPRAEFPGWYN